MIASDFAVLSDSDKYGPAAKTEDRINPEPSTAEECLHKCAAFLALKFDIPIVQG
jgi:hypothetical protein